MATMTDRLTEAPMQSASEIARRVVNGEQTAMEVLESHLALIAELNPRLERHRHTLRGERSTGGGDR